MHHKFRHSIFLTALALAAISQAADAPRQSAIRNRQFAIHQASEPPGRHRDQPAWAKPLGRLDPVQIPESSGIDRSDRYPGIYWTHNDSGNVAELFAITLDGAIVARIPVFEAVNLDWEDIAVDGGFIYVGDIGNNFGWLSTRTIYRFAEPDPHAAEVKPIKPQHMLRFRYPGAPFDSESLIVRGERIWIINKGGRSGSTVYRLVDTGDAVWSLEAVQELKSAAFTGADLSDDGRWLAATSVWLLSCYPVNDDLTLRDDEQPKYVRYAFGGGVEACCFDGQDVIVTAESGTIHRIPKEIIDTQNPFQRKPKGSE